MHQVISHISNLQGKGKYIDSIYCIKVVALGYSNENETKRSFGGTRTVKTEWGQCRVMNA